MPLNKLDNFIKNTEGRILYVSPADLDATDSIDNTGNSLARPFKTVQRALIESARFSYLKGNNNDEIEKTTILLMPGEHIVDNRPGLRIKESSGQPIVVAPSGAESVATTELKLDLNTSFDLTQENNILYKFNSVNGGIIVPRGTSIVGLDLRKTKIRPLYVPNPTDDNVDPSAIFRITGTCYFWQFSIFDGLESGTVYTDPIDFSTNNKSKPIFSHHKLTCFEYADGVNLVSDSTGSYDLTDLDMYYAKLSNAYGTGSGSPNRDIDSKYPAQPDGFAKQRPEWEIVGAFATDPITILDIESGDGGTATNQITVTTATDHNLSTGTPIKIRGVSVEDYNVSTKVQSVDPDNPKVFTYLLPTFRANLPAQPDETGATVTIETDTVSGASPYIFNISMRSVYGLNGMHADGSKASGFRSMVVAQFTGVSLQKDDRAFVKYDKTSRAYSGISYVKTAGADLSNESSSTNPAEIYHLDSDAIYRSGWEQTHIKVTNDAILQIVSVFAIGYNKHFVCESGGDASITNSNSNFGQLSLTSDGFKKEAFDKDNKAFITNVIPPRANIVDEENVDWLSIDVGVTTSVGLSTHLYLRGFTTEDEIPPVLTQGYRVGAKVDDKLFINFSNISGYGTSEASILMENGVNSSFREFNVTEVSGNKFTIGLNNGLKTGEKVILISDSGDYPENIIPHVPYYIISLADSVITADRSKVKLASTKTDAENGNEITLYFGSDLRILSRVTDKSAGEAGHPVQFDSSASRWFITVNSNNQIYNAITTLGQAVLGEETDPTFVTRSADIRSLDEKIYKFRVVVPKELENAKTPESGFVIQESSTTNVRDQNDFTLSEFPSSFSKGATDPEYTFNKNPRFIATCNHTSSTSTVRVELPHNLEVGDQIIIRNVTDTVNTDASFDKGYNGTFTVLSVPNNLEFTYTNTQNPSPGDFTNDTSVRNESLPRYERNDLQDNFYIYRNEIINEYIDGQQDGVYHVYALKADSRLSSEFTDLSYSQNVTDLYPQLDRDNIDDSPLSTKTKALLSPLGDVHTSNLKGSITRESADTFITKFTENLTIDNPGSLSGGTQTITLTKNHSLNGIVQGTITNQGSGYTPGTYYNVKLLNGSQTGTWAGATATVVVNGSGNVIDAKVTSRGSGYSAGNLYFDQTIVGSGSNALFNISSEQIVSSDGDYVQITGIGTIADSYNLIDSIPGTNQISIARTTGDPIIAESQILIHVGTAASVSSVSFTSTTGISTFTCTGPHGLVSGNKFRVLDTTNNNIGDFIVKSRVGVNTFEVATSSQLTNPDKVLKHFFSSNTGTSDSSAENLAKRASTFYDKDSLQIDVSGGIGINTTLIPVSHPSAGIGTTERFPIGSYIQIDNEIMRVSASDFTGTNKLNVIRGVLSSESTQHADGSLIRKIKPIPVEFRRNSIIRASGHTFEYLGYGPGNYSTGLPQVQTRTLTEREEFLSQAQERSAGIVVYTGMNNRGDFYIGNTKKSSATGEETSFDTPIPTVSGEDPARLSAIFDEITVKERIVVEGGDSGEILSQFDGPVTFNKNVRIKDSAQITGKVRITDDTESDGTNSGALVLGGGLGVNGSIYANSFNGDASGLFNLPWVRTAAGVHTTAYVAIGTLPGQVYGTSDIALNVVGGGFNFEDSDGRTVLRYEDGPTTRGLTLNIFGDQDGGAAANSGYVQTWDSEWIFGTEYTNANRCQTSLINPTSSGTRSARVGFYTPPNTSGDGTILVMSHEVQIPGRGPNINFVGSRGSDEATYSTTFNNDVLGRLTFQGSVGTGPRIGAAIQVQQDNVGSANTNTGVSGRLQFYTTPEIVGTGSGEGILTLPVERMTIKGDGKVGIGITLPEKTLHVNGDTRIVGELQVTDDITAFYSSDERLKDNITPIDDPLAKVISISGNTFDWNENTNNEGSDTGVIAQEIEALGLPGLVTTRDNGYKAVRYEKLVPLLVEAIKELSDKVDALEQKLSDK